MATKALRHLEVKFDFRASWTPPPASPQFEGGGGNIWGRGIRELTLDAS